MSNPSVFSSVSVPPPPPLYQRVVAGSEHMTHVHCLVLNTASFLFYCDHYCCYLLLCSDYLTLRHLNQHTWMAVEAMRRRRPRVLSKMVLSLEMYSPQELDRALV